MNKLKILKKSLFTTIVALILVGIIGCQTALPTFTPEPDDEIENPQDELPEETYNELYEYYYDSGFDVKNIKSTGGVTLYCGDNLDGYKVNDVIVNFSEGSLTDKIQYGAVMVNDEVFGENFYNEGILDNAYYNNYSAKYQYDKDGKIISIEDNVDGANIYKYYYDFEGNLKLILKNGEAFKSYVYGFEDYEIAFKNGEFYNGFDNGDYYSQYGDIRREYFYKYCSKDILYLYYQTVLESAGSVLIKSGTKYVAEMDWYNYSVNVFIYNDNNEVEYNPIGRLSRDSRPGYGDGRFIVTSVFYFGFKNETDDAVYEYNYEYAGNRYLTKKINGSNLYTYEYINNYVVAEICEGEENYAISYIFDADFNRIGFYYDNEVFYYNISIIGNVESIINEKGEIVVKYLVDVFGNINYYKQDTWIPDGIPPAISGLRKDDIGLYNSFIYKINENFMYDRYAKKYHVNENTIFDVDTCAFIKPVKKGSEWASFYADPVNAFIFTKRQKQLSLDTLLKEKIQALMAECLGLNEIDSYINAMVWAFSGIMDTWAIEENEEDVFLEFEEFKEAFLKSNPDFYKNYDMEYLKANFPRYAELYDDKTLQNLGDITIEYMYYDEYIANQQSSTCHITFKEDFDFDATGKSVGRADVFTSTKGEMGQIYGGQLYIVAKNTEYNVANAEKRRQNLTLSTFVSDGVQSYMPYTGEFEFRGHFIYLNRYITFDTDLYGIVTFKIYENYRANFDYSYGNLYNYDINDYEIIFQSTGQKFAAYTLAEIAAQTSEKTYNDLINAQYGFEGGITTTGLSYYYFNEEAAEQLKKSQNRNYTVFGYDPEELEDKMAEGYYLTNKNGVPTFEVKQSGDEIDIGSILTKIAIGTGIIIVSATIIAVTGGGATPIACFFATTATLSAVSIAGGVIAAGIDFAMGGSMQKVADSFANGFLFTAVLSSAVTLTTGVGAACFAENTPVQTQNGAVPIQHVKPFDFVLSYNHQTQLTEYKRVVKTYAKEVGETVTIIAGEEKIVTTLEHPFFANGAYVAAKDLKAGDKLKNSDNKYVKVKNVKINKLKDKITVYNFDVEDNQNYFAGGVLVHNVCNGAQSLGGIGGAGAVPGGYSLKNVAMLFGKITLGVVSAGTLLSFNFKRVGDPIDYGRGYIPVGDLFISRFWVYTKDHFGSVYDKTGLKKVYRMAYIDQNNILQVVGRWIVPRTNPNDIYIPRVGVWGYALNANQALTILWLGGVYNRTVAPHITDANYTVDGVENFDQIVLDNYYDPMVQEVFKIFVHNIPSAKAVGVYAYDPHDAMYLAMRAGLTPSVTGPTWYDQWDTWLAGGTMVESYFISGYEQAGHFHFVDPTKSIYLWYMDPYYTAFYANKNGLQYRRNNPWTKHAFE